MNQAHRSTTAKAPMGWNSFDCFATTVTEAEVLENARFLADRLLPFGWDHVVVDGGWYHPNPPICTNANQLHESIPYMAMDTDHRFIPAVERFPSSSHGKGFSPLASKIHELGLKFGIHIMRGFPRQAMYPGYPARSSGLRPSEIADTTSTCEWLNHMYGVQTRTPAGQAYYNSIFQMYASWGVDFIKVDDIAYPYRREELEMVDQARGLCGRPMTLSLSPGPCPLGEAAHVSAHADMWRICADFWDDWNKLKEAFELCRIWAPTRQPNRWPDPDMLPLGRLSKRGPVGPEHDSFFTRDEQRTMLSLWCLFCAPLFMGGNLLETDEETLGLLTNPEVLEVHRKGSGGIPLRHTEEESVWISEGISGKCYVGIFNLSDVTRSVEIDWSELGFQEAPGSLRDLWQRQDLRVRTEGIGVSLDPHSSALYSMNAVSHGASKNHRLAPSSVVGSRSSRFNI